MGVLLLLVAALWGFASAAGFVGAALSGRPALARRMGALLLGGATLYTAILLVTSLRSKEIVLPIGVEKKFCGFYLDCHLGAAVAGVSLRDRIGPAEQELRATGRFHVVRLEVANDARRATLTPAGLEVTVRDAAGRSYPRNLPAETALERETGRRAPFIQPLQPGASYETTLVFDLPPEAREPRLLVNDLAFPDQIIELFLIDDEDSLFHRKVWFDMTPAGS